MPSKTGILFRVGKRNKDIQDMYESEIDKALEVWSHKQLRTLIKKLVVHIRIYT